MWSSWLVGSLVLTVARAELSPGDATETRAELSVGDVYAGSYTCGSSAWLMLHIEAVSAESVSAVFHFIYPTSMQHGAYVLHGRPQANAAGITSSRLIKFDPGEWLLVGSGKVVKVGLLAIISADGLKLSGEVMHTSCGRFELRRTLLDIAPPETTVDIGTLAQPGAQPSVLRLTATGALAEAEGAGGRSRQRLQMMINGVAGMAEEARQNREAAKAAKAASAAQPPPAAATPPRRAARDASTRSPSTDEQGWLVGPRLGEGSERGEPAAVRATVAELESSVRSAIDRGDFAGAYAIWAGWGATNERRDEIGSAEAAVAGEGSAASELVQRLVAINVVQGLAERAEAAPVERELAESSAREREALHVLAIFVSLGPRPGYMQHAAIQAPCAVHAGPSTLYLPPRTSNTLYLISYTLYLIPYTLHLTPYTFHLLPLPKGPR